MTMPIVNDLNLVTVDIKSSSDMFAARNLELISAKTSTGSCRCVCPFGYPSPRPFIDSRLEICPACSSGSTASFDRM